MIKINWDIFKTKNPNPTKSFEDMCYHLFCRSHHFFEGIHADFNQIGLETYPEKSAVSKMKVGFQAKFFENDRNYYQQIKSSVTKAIKTYPKTLDEITIYVNIPLKISSQPAKDIVASAAKNGVKINWFTLSNFEILLNQPSNLDLAQVFFGLGDEEGFIRHNLTIEDSNYIQSADLIDLPIITGNNSPKVKISLSNRIISLIGNPGSGKSLFLKKIFYDEAGLALPLNDFKIKKNLPMFISLKDCYYDTLENIIRNRQNDYKVKKSSLSYIYILDGLDELNEVNAESTLQYIRVLATQSHTQNIIISCRRGSLNKLKMFQYLPDLKQYEIGNLNIKHVERYFSLKHDGDKLEKLRALKKSNPSLLKDINDIFMVKLLWDTIDSLNRSSTVIDLLDHKVMSQLTDMNHKNNIEQLNILNPKDIHLLKLNEKLSYRFSKKYQYRFKHNEVVKILKKKFKRNNYRSLNEILSFNTNAFFDTGINNSNASEVTYIYHHRRYQEYFFARGLKRRFEKNIKILRKDKLIINSDFFHDIFLKYIENAYLKDNNIAGLTLLNSIKNYIKHGDPWYISESETFIQNLALQNDGAFEMLMNDEVLDLKSTVARTYPNALQFYEHDKIPFALKIEAEIERNLGGWNPEDTEGFIFFKIYVKKEAEYKDYFKSYYKNFCSKLSKDLSFRLMEMSQFEYALRAFFKIGLKHDLENLILLIEDLNAKEVVCLLDLLSENQFLPLVFSTEKLKISLTERIKNYNNKADLKNLSVFFFKKVLDLKISETQITNSILALSSIKDRMNRHFFQRFIRHFILCYTIVGEEKFNQSIKMGGIMHTDILKCSKLFNLYIDLLKDKNSFSRTLNNYKNTFKNKVEAYDSTKIVLAKIWAFIFYKANSSHLDFIQMTKVLEDDFDAIIFFDQLNTINNRFVSNVFAELDLLSYEAELLTWKDNYSKYVDRCFLLGGIFSNINSKKVVDYFREGFSNSIIRHGWRKDIIISEYLNHVFGEILKKRWFSKEVVIKISKKLYKLNLRLYEVTDKDHTRYGMSSFLKSLSTYDIELAYKYLEKFKELDLDWSVKNIATVEILINDIKQNSIEYYKVREKINGLSTMYDYKGELAKSHYLQLFSVEMEVLKSDFYDERVKKLAFEHAHKAVEKVNGKFDFDRIIYNDYYYFYNELCKLHNEKNLIPEPPKDEYIVIPENKFSALIDEANNLDDIKNLYNKFDDSLKYKIQLRSGASWKKFVDKTYDLTGDISFFINTLDRFDFMHGGFGYSYNSDYLQLGVAYSMIKVETSQQMFQYLTERSGHAGFYKTILIYIEMRDKKTTIKLFNRFYEFCDFLLN